MINNVRKYSKDTVLNFERVLAHDPESELSETQLALIALAVAIGTKSNDLVALVKSKVESLDSQLLQSVYGAVSLMAMNNVYYRSLHLMENQDYMNMPAKLRMSLMADPGCDKVDFELMSLAVSALSGCGLCLDSHEKHLRLKLGVSQAAIAHTIKIAAVINSMAQVLYVESLAEEF